MRDLHQERIRELINNIYQAEVEIEELRKEYKLKSSKEELKRLLSATIEPNDKGHHTVIVDGLKALLFKRAGRQTLDRAKAKELLHPNTYNAILKIGKEQTVLDISVAKDE